MAIEEGKKAPAFTLSDENGKQHALKDYAGKHVLVYFYPKDDTPGCTKEACGRPDHRLARAAACHPRRQWPGVHQ